MEYAVIRFVRHEQPEQWIIPVDELWDYLHPAEDEDDAPLLFMSVTLEKGQMHSLMFQYVSTPITTASGFVNQGRYLLFEPKIPPKNTVLDAFITQLAEIPNAQRVQVQSYTAYNTYRP